MKKVVGLVIGLLPVSAFAECVPVPDCASIGYTETSCEGDSLKCPFDTTKLKCIPCDSSFRHSCSGENIKNPIGNACNNKYVACECEDRTTFVNGECVCDTSCNTIGNIYYSDGTCNSCNITDKTPVGIVAYKNASKHLIMSLESNNLYWAVGPNTTQTQDLSNLTNYSEINEALKDHNGHNNTKIITEYYGENASDIAAIYCYNYFPTNLEESKNQWYLPAAGELYNIIYINKTLINDGLSSLGLSSITPVNHWSSTECSSVYSWHISSYNGDITYRTKWSPVSVRCVYSIKE